MEDTIRLAAGDVLLWATKHRTVLTPIAPLNVRFVEARGHYRRWGHREWEEFLRKARPLLERFPGTEEELRRIELHQRRFLREIPAVDEDSATSREFELIHTVEIRYSKRRGYIRITGATYPHRDRLKRAGFHWNSELGCWETEYSSDAWRRTVNLVRRIDQPSDPLRLGYRRCWACARWLPPEKLRDSPHGPYCGCLDISR